MIRKSLISKLLKLPGFTQVGGIGFIVSGIDIDSIVIDLGANEGAFSKACMKNIKRIVMPQNLIKICLIKL